MEFWPTWLQTLIVDLQIAYIVSSFLFLLLHDVSLQACQSYATGGADLYVAKKVPNAPPTWSIATLDPLDFTVTYCKGDLIDGVTERSVTVCDVHHMTLHAACMC